MQCLVEHASLRLHCRLELLPHVTGLWTVRRVELGALLSLPEKSERQVRAGTISHVSKRERYRSPPWCQARAPSISLSEMSESVPALLARVERECSPTPRRRQARIFRSPHQRRARAFPLSLPEMSEIALALLARDEHERSCCPCHETSESVVALLTGDEQDCESVVALLA